MSSELVIKMCIVGDDTDLNYKFGRMTATSKFDENYRPNLGYDLPTKNILIDKIPAKLIIMIISGEDFFAKLRPAYYHGAVGCLILFDKGNNTSFSSVPCWLTEFTSTVKKNSIPIALVGIITDHDVITYEAGQSLAEQLNVGYYESRITDKQQNESIFTDMTIKMMKSYLDT